jgi:hypothetical protein
MLGQFYNTTDWEVDRRTDNLGGFIGQLGTTAPLKNIP